MKSASLRRWLSAVATVAILATAIVGAYFFSKGPDANPAQAKDAAGSRDWPLFGGSVQRNLVNLVEKDMPTAWSVKKDAEKNIKWSVELGSKAYGGPVVSRGKLFIGTNNEVPRDPAIKGDKGILMCFNEPDGKFLWQAVHNKLPGGQVHDWPKEGICSTPVVEGDRMWYVNNRCEVVCADVHGDNGKAKILWTLDMMGALGVVPHNLATCSPLLVGDTLFVITSNGVDEKHIDIPAPTAPSFLALDKKKGTVLWKDNAPSINLVEARKKAGKEIPLKNLVDTGLVLMHGQWANPVYAEPNGKPMIIFPGGDGWIRGYNPKNGELLWKFDCNPKKSIYKLGPEGTRNDFVSTPVIWQNKLYIGVGQDPEHDKAVGHLWCIDITKEPKNPDKDISPVNDNFDPKAAVNMGSGLVWHYGGAAPEGAERNYFFGRTLSTCAVHDGLCYAAEYDGFLHCLDALTGQQYWEHDMGADTWGSPYWVDGKVYIGNEDAKLLIFEHGKTKKKIGEIDMRPTPKSSTRIRSTPVAVNGVLYVMTENPCKLYAITK